MRGSLLVVAFVVSGGLAVAQVTPTDGPAVRGRVDVAVATDDRAAPAVDADVLAVPIFAGEDASAALEGAPDALRQSVSAAARQGQLSGRLYSHVSIYGPAGYQADRLLLIGAGERASFTADRLSELAGVAVRQVRSANVGSLAVLVRGDVEAAAAAEAVAEGAVLASFDPGIHKSQRSPSTLTDVRILGLPGGNVAASIARGEVMAHATNMARSLTMEPANYLTPKIMAEHARAVAREEGLAIDVFDEQELARRGMGGILAVGKGSANPPRLIVMRYRAPAPTKVTLAIAGKGVCFDSGGISLKPGPNMYKMKGDMAGGAAVIAAMRVIARLKPDVNVIGLVPAVENLPSGTAQKPGDVFVNLSGKTVEVMSTDAEGRLILSEAISYAVDEGATHIVDVATLTGSKVSALGDRYVGLFSPDDAFVDRFMTAARRAGERYWRLPVDEEYATQIKSSLVADLNETGGQAGASVGAKFIQQFTGGLPWIHLDIAGSEWPAETAPYMAPGATGVTVRTLAELALLMNGETSTNQ